MYHYHFVQTKHDTDSALFIWTSFWQLFQVRLRWHFSGQRWEWSDGCV